jgi:hypothetical protein
MEINMENLFTNNQEYITFCNLKAKGRIISLEKSEKQYADEIEQTLKKCGEICENYQSSNYINEILDIETKLQSIEGQRYSANQLEELTSKKTDIYHKYNNFLAGLPLNTREDLEFLTKKLFDRQARLKKSQELISEIEDEYRDARSLNVEETFKTLPILMSISSYLTKEDKEQTMEEEVDSQKINLPYVVKITEAPAQLLSNLKEDKAPTEEETMQELSTDNSFFDPTDDFTTSIENEKITPVIAENDENYDNEDKLTYEMIKGDSLTKVALAVCDDENGWYDIYKANKKIIDDKLKELGLNHEEPFEENEEIFAGMSLIIPNIYEKNNSPEIKLAA